MERVRHPGAVAAAGHPLLPHRRLRGLPRLLQRGRRARRGGAPAGARRRRLRRRGAGVLDPRLVRRSDPQQHAALGRRTAGDLDLPRTGAPEVLPARRHRLQRILRHLRRTGRYPPVARVSWTAAGGRPRGEAPRAVHRAGPGQSCAPRSTLCRAVGRCRQACRQGCRIPAPAPRVRGAEPARMGWRVAVQGLDRRAVQQCQAASLRPLRPMGGGVRRAVPPGWRQLAGVLCAGPCPWPAPLAERQAALQRLAAAAP